MSRFSTFDLDLDALKEGAYTYHYDLDNAFFKNIDSEEVTKGHVSVDVTLKKANDRFRFDFVIAGTVIVPCDRCLDDLEVEVETQEVLNVKFGKSYAEEDDNTIVIPENESVLNLSFFIFEFIELSLPLKKIHPAGKCNKGMSSKLSKHIVADADSDEEEELNLIPMGDDEIVNEEVELDPRWAKLKEINIEND